MNPDDFFALLLSLPVLLFIGACLLAELIENLILPLLSKLDRSHRPPRKS
jgi:hypothetical protein